MNTTTSKAKTIGAKIKGDAAVLEVETPKGKPVRQRKAKVIPEGLQVSEPKEFTKCMPIKAVYRTGKKDVEICINYCTIVSIRNDGLYYRVEGIEAEAIELASSKVMMIEAAPAELIAIAPNGEVAIAAAAPAVKPKDWEKSLQWTERTIKVSDLPDPYKSVTQIDDRLNPGIVAEFAADMKPDENGETLWDWTREGSRPRVFLDEVLDTFAFGDGHHTTAGAKLAELAEIPCLVTFGTAHDAKRYSYLVANRNSSQPITNAQKEEWVAGTLSDRVMLDEILEGIYLETGKQPNPKDAGVVPAGRAIAQWSRGLVSYKTVEKIWKLMIAGGMAEDYPWLLETRRMGIDGKVRKELGTLSVEKPAPKVPPTATPAPTDKAAVAPVQRLEGKAAVLRCKEYAQSMADEMLKRLCAEMSIKVPAAEIHEELRRDIEMTLNYALTGPTE